MLKELPLSSKHTCDDHMLILENDLLSLTFFSPFFAFTIPQIFSTTTFAHNINRYFNGACTHIVHETEKESLLATISIFFFFSANHTRGG